MLKALFDWVSPPPLRSAASLAAFTEREAARLTQKCTVNYCRVKAAADAKKLFAEESFRDALVACRWEAYGLILGDFLRVAATQLRHEAGRDAEPVVDGLAAFYARTLLPHPRPAKPEAGWGEAVDGLRAALADTRLAPPLAAAEISRPTGRAIFHALPIHKSLRRDDAEVVVNQVRFGTVSLQQELEHRLDVPAVIADSRAAAP